MRPIDESRRSVLRAMAALGAVSSASLAACGGGGADEAQTVSAASLTIGPITGFGSVIVNGVAFDESTADVTDDDGMVLSAAALKLGMSVEVDSDLPDTANSRARARAIRFGWEIVGPVTRIDAVAGTLVVLDQTVRLHDDCHFDELLPDGLAAVAPGAILAVNGFIDERAGEYLATRIEPRPSAPVYRLRGRLRDVDIAAGTCRIGAALISFAGLGVDKLPREMPEGLMVRATLNKLAVAGRWTAIAIRHAAVPAASLARTHVRGAITDFVSAQDFAVNGLRVDARAALFPDGTDGLALGVRVEVVGLLREGVLVAARVELDERHRHLRHGVRLLGPVNRLEPAVRRMHVRQVPVYWDDRTVFEGGVEADLANGVKVAVAGIVAFDRRIVRALLIRFEA